MSINGLIVLPDKPVGRTCLENRPACQMMCCRTLALTATPPLRHEKQIIGTIPTETYKKHRKYYTIHGIERLHEEGRTTVVKVVPEDIKKCIPLQEGVLLVYRTCDMLEEETGKCKLHYRGKPEVCKNGYTKLREGIVWFKQCIYRENMPVGSMSLDIQSVMNTGELEEGKHENNNPREDRNDGTNKTE